MSLIFKATQGIATVSYDVAFSMLSVKQNYPRR